MSRTDPPSTQVVLRLPPAGLLLPCDKPPVQGTWPQVVNDDIPRLKDALKACSQQIDDYLDWRARYENPTEERETP